ncbi:MAG TPA: glutamate-5-semialdehyde dehydrogenase [Chromatiaceae bacterium]|jgi:glutamate-5-semialdehyde dehydrogenase|nr:MAG: glutamate-5-semialdehyde dehydrogenase [Thiohalocapsa sp. PB-PSB1]HBG96347.1 glutamate-5-semialdehyde dehydrogenase [Chromatiaceae bacterium]HCS90635.1 glutamate-5-semialdehyde dehydrogenase [Chromatiaceae bacterium]
MSESIADSVRKQAMVSKQAARKLAAISGEVRAAALNEMAASLQQSRAELIRANEADLADARAAGLPAPMIKRLEISDKVFAQMQKRLLDVAALPDPVGQVLEGFTRPNGLRVTRVSVPLGVIGMIYESRPNVTTDAASVCLKAGNSVILRGGSESLRTNIVLADAMIAASDRTGIPAGTLQIIRTADREAVRSLLQQEDLIDVLIPRGGKSLIQRVAEESRIPVIKHYEGICHMYLAADAEEQSSVALAVNSKCQRVEVCNALETLLVDAASAGRLLPAIKAAFEQAGVELRGCPRTREILPGIDSAADEDWETEYLAPILSIRVVEGIADAIEHINTFGSGHTDVIVTRDMRQAQTFVDQVDSGSVLVNASTRLSGGGDYGMGAMIGISTDKLHARGPVGPRELTSYKWIAYGDTHLRE